MIKRYLTTEEEHESKAERRKLRSRAARYNLIEGALYKRSFTIPYLKCLTKVDAEYTLREIHKGIYGNHLGARTIAHKLIRGSYYSPIMKKDVAKHIQKYEKC